MSNQCLCFFLLALMATPALSSPSITPDDLDDLRVKIWDLIDKSEEPGCSKCGTPLLAQLVRLAFHDCVGGCDGVLDTSFAANAGLKIPIEAVQPIYDQFQKKTGISRADFWALTGTLALYRGAANQACPASGDAPAFPSVPFVVGRKDGGKPEDESQDFPDPHKGVVATLAWAKRVFGFSKRDAVAIMGAHTLGRGRRTNSGFEHAWTATPDTLDNSYYADMADTEGKLHGWAQIQVEHDKGEGLEGSPKHFEWVHHDDEAEGLMLNSDMCLYKDIEPKEKGSHTGKVKCSYAECGPQKEQVDEDAPEEFSLAELVKLYALDNPKWMADFSDAFARMTTTGAPSSALRPIPYEPPRTCGAAVKPQAPPAVTVADPLASQEAIVS